MRKLLFPWDNMCKNKIWVLHLELFYTYIYLFLFYTYNYLFCECLSRLKMEEDTK